MTDNVESDRGPTCEPKCHAWGIGCACSGARVYQHPTPDTADSDTDLFDALDRILRDPSGPMTLPMRDLFPDASQEVIDALAYLAYRVKGVTAPASPKGASVSESKPVSAEKDAVSTRREWAVQKASYPLGTGLRWYGDDEEGARRDAPLVIGSGAYVVCRQVITTAWHPADTTVTASADGGQA